MNPVELTLHYSIPPPLHHSNLLMPRFYLPPEQCLEPTLVLAEEEAHHALHVLRVRRGERLTVLDGVGHEFVCEVKELARHKVSLAVVAKHEVPPPACRITLLQALPKGKLMEAIIQKATELAASRIVPLLSERVIAKLDSRDAQHKTAKWQSIAIESTKQCGSAWLPKVETPLTPQQFLARKEKFDLALLASLQSDARHPREYFRALLGGRDSRPESACIWIGPEGDFSPAESEAIKSVSALPITLGTLVLRTETAAIYCLSILNYELQAPR